MDILKTNGLKQITLLILIAFIGILLVWQLQYFIPGFLGAFTLYIVLRQYFFRLTIIRKWKKWLAALLLIVTCLIVFVLPIWLLVELLIPQFAYAFNHSSELMAQGDQFLLLVKKYFPQLKIDDQSVRGAVQQVVVIVPKFLNATMSVVVNTMVAFFILYFMLMSGRDMERRLVRLLPLKDSNKDSLWWETRNMVVSNAIGIPVLIVCQCIVAIFGYWIFKVDQPVIWGVLTGVASIIPMVGTMIIWIPVCVIVMASGNVGLGVGLSLYCAIVVSNIDNVLRFTIMKKIGDVHPLITVFGVIVGLQLFGIMGLIFGPLLLAYFILLMKIYRLEFSSSATSPEATIINSNENSSGSVIQNDITINNHPPS